MSFTLAASHGRLALAQSNGNRVVTDGKSAEPPDQENHLAVIAKAERALADAERRFGPDHPNVAKPLFNLAILHQTQGRYAVAEQLCRRLVKIAEKALGPDHPDVGGSLILLVNLYYYQGRYTEAEPLHKRALAIREKALGPDHPDVGVSLNNLAELFQSQDHYAKAEPLYKRSLAICEKALGPDHPQVGTSLFSLAGLYGISAGRHDIRLASIRIVGKTTAAKAEYPLRHSIFSWV